MKLNYLIISTDPLTIKFFYDEDDYGEFYMRFKRVSRNARNTEDSVGVRGEAEIIKKDPEYATQLTKAMAEAFGLRVT